MTSEKKSTLGERMEVGGQIVFWVSVSVVCAGAGLALITAFAISLVSFASCRIDPTTERCTVLHERSSFK